MIIGPLYKKNIKFYSPFARKPEIHQIRANTVNCILCLTLVMISKQLDHEKRASVDSTELFIPHLSYIFLCEWTTKFY